MGRRLKKNKEKLKSPKADKVELTGQLDDVRSQMEDVQQEAKDTLE